MNSDPRWLRDGYSEKWHRFSEEVLPLWVADMDYPLAEEIRSALIRRLDFRLGYGLQGGDPRLKEAIAGWLQRRQAWSVSPDQMWLNSSVVGGLHAASLGLCSAGEEILCLTPIYPPFMSAIASHGRVPKYSALVWGGNAAGYRIDFDHLRAQISPATRLLMLCSPHNPSGRVWSRAELEGLADLALRNRLWIVSDELHADLIFEGTHLPIADLSDEVAERTVTLTGPGKSFNIPGLAIGVAISRNRQLLERLKQASTGLLGGPNVLAQEAMLAAYTRGEPWLAGVLETLRHNRERLGTWIATHLPEAAYHPPEGTYLAWLGLEQLKLPCEPGKFLLEQGLVAFNEGSSFGPGGEGHVRINLATQPQILDRALSRALQALSPLRGEYPA